MRGINWNSNWNWNWQLELELELAVLEQSGHAGVDPDRSEQAGLAGSLNVRPAASL